MIFKRFTSKDVGAVAELHYRIFDQTPLSKLGQDYLESLYKKLSLDLSIGFVVYDKNRLLGVIFATMDLKQTRKNMSKRFFIRTVSLLLKKIFSNKLKFQDVIKRLTFNYLIPFMFKPPYPTILILLVDRNFRRQGIGKNLIYKVLKEMNKRGIKKVYVDTLIKNKKALIFYRKVGFKIERQFIDSVILSFDLDNQKIN